MSEALEQIRQVGLRQWVHDRSGLWLAEGTTELRPAQEDALEWAFSRPQPYLLINAPTGIGKTLLNLVYGLARGGPLTYAVHTIRLQEQVSTTLPGLPVLTGRNNHPCLIGQRTHGIDITAKYGVCTMRVPCDYRDGADLEGTFTKCAYYDQLDNSLQDGVGRITNYAMYLALPPVKFRMENEFGDVTSTGTRVLVADEAHNIEEVLCSSAEIVLVAPQIRAAGYGWPKTAPRTIKGWRGWGFGLLKRTDKDDPRPYIQDARAAAIAMASIKEADFDSWAVSFDGTVFRARPMWGREYTLSKLLGRERGEPPFGAGRLGVPVLFTSATLMGAEYIAESLGLPPREWAYLDMDSPFEPDRRPINYSPVVAMNKENMRSPEDRAEMQKAIDTLISRYVMREHPFGIIHTVSNWYRDAILTESRFRGIMVSDPEVHMARVAAGTPSVLVSANLTEGWDGVDNLCRFVIMPKVPFGDLGDEWTRRRRAVDARTYDHSALVSVVQGAGRGMRHREDYCDTWILDGAWGSLFKRHQDWLPKAFLDAYHHNVPLQ